MMPLRFPGTTLWTALVCSILLLTGCEEEVTAVLGTERAYSLYGLFTPERDTQWVLVYPIEGRLAPTPRRPLDARVTSTDLQTGEVRVWQDSLIQGTDGFYDPFFWSPFRAGYGHTYRLEAERTDSVTSYVEAAVPPRVDIELLAPTTTSFVVLPVRVTGGAPHLLKIELEYAVRYAFSTPPEVVVLAFEDEPQQTEDGWVIRISLREHYRALQQVIMSKDLWRPDFGLMLSSMELRMIVADAAWDPPGGVFDPEVLVQPGTMSNVENGFGFVGAGYRLRRHLAPPDDVLKAAGFKLPTDPPSAVSAAGSKNR